MMIDFLFYSVFIHSCRRVVCVFLVLCLVCILSTVCAVRTTGAAGSDVFDVVHCFSDDRQWRRDFASRLQFSRGYRLEVESISVYGYKVFRVFSSCIQQLYSSRINNISHVLDKMLSLRSAGNVFDLLLWLLLIRFLALFLASGLFLSLSVSAECGPRVVASLLRKALCIFVTLISAISGL